jgi:hypothetical protein
MLKGKKLYEEARRFVEEEVVPKLQEEEDPEDPTDPIATKGAELGMALAIDIAESLNGIKAKIG